MCKLSLTSKTEFTMSTDVYNSLLGWHLCFYCKFPLNENKTLIKVVQFDWKAYNWLRPHRKEWCNLMRFFLRKQGCFWKKFHFWEVDRLRLGGVGYIAPTVALLESLMHLFLFFASMMQGILQKWTLQYMSRNICLCVLGRGMREFFLAWLFLPSTVTIYFYIYMLVANTFCLLFCHEHI